MTTNQERAAELLYNEGCGSGDTAHYIARRLADAGLLTPDPQIIRTFEEVLTLSPDTVMIDSENEAVIPDDYTNSNGEAIGVFINDLPAVVVASGEQVRAARRALEKEKK